MNLSAHLDNLETRKSDIEDEIEFELHRPMPNFLKMSELKRKKLVIKQEIIKLMNKRKTA